MKKILGLTLFSALLCFTTVRVDAAENTKPDVGEAPQVVANSAEGKVEASLVRMRELVKSRKWAELIEQFKDEDLAAWTAGFKDKSVATVKVAEASHQRGLAYIGIKDGAKAENDFKLAVALLPTKGDYWFNLADAYVLLKDDPKAVDAYNKAFECAGKSNNFWMPLSATINSASIFLKQEKYQEAIEVMKRYDDNDIKEMAPVWGDRMRAVNEQINVKFGDQLNSMLVVLSDNGKSDYQIIVPENYPTPAIEADMTQVARLVQTAFKANGADLSVVTESARDTAKPGIFLGDTEFARANGVDIAQLKDWSYVFKAIGRDIIIVGRDESAPGRGVDTPDASGFDRIGTAKAATDFLQSYAGTRFLYPDNSAWSTLASVANVDLLATPTIEYLPTPKIAVPLNLDIKKTPVLEYDVASPPTTGFYRLAQNRFPVVDSTFGGHTWHRAIPSDEATFAAHPEYFALLGGKRVVTGGGAQVQYCISNPDVQDLLYKDLEKHFKMGYQVTDLGQPDGFRGCQCDSCKQLFNTGSDWSEKVWILHRNLAERAYKEFPDRIVSIAVYAITETLPKTFQSFPPNVRLMLCGTKDSDFRDWKNFGAPQGFSTYLYYWCPNMMPRYFPMRTPLYVETAANRLMAANVHSISRDGNGGIAYGLEGPTYYTMGRMFDGPGIHTAKELVIEFVNAAFGKSAPAMMSFYDQLYKSLEIYSRYMATREDGWSYIDIYGRGHKHLSNPEGIIAFLYPMELIKALEKQLALAENSENSPKVEMRLALVRSEFDYLKAVVNAVHLYNAYQASSDAESLERLLKSIDDLRSFVDKLYAKGNGLKGWACSMFPPNGHSADHLKLRYNGYQEPYVNSFLNWDTVSKRQAPMADAKNMVSSYAKEPVKIDSPRWDSVKPQALSSTNPSNTKPLDTQVRVMYDDANLYIRFDDALPPDATAEAVEKERVEAYLVPVVGSPVSYRFSAGLNPASRAQAARGLIEDMMNLDYGKFDAMWTCEWTHTAIHDTQANRLSVMMTIPLKSIPPAVASPDANWYVNFQRTNPAGAAAGETCVWSVIPGGTGIEDPRGNGELSFSGEGSPAGSAKNPMEKWRDEYNGKMGDMPAEWKKLPNLLPTPLGPWFFRQDPTEQGIKENWFAQDATPAEWTPVKVPGFWAETEAVGNYQGIGWYRTNFTLPAEWKGKSLRLLFGSVDEQAWIYVNGKLVREHSEKSEGKEFGLLWEEAFTADVSPESLNYGKDKENVLAVRVNNSAMNGGIWRPVMGCAVETK